MKKGVKFLVISAAVTLFSIATGALATAVVDASSNTEQKQEGKTDKQASKRLAKAGYVFRLNQDARISLHAHKAATLPKEEVKQLINDRVLFKIDQVSSLRNGVQVHLVDQTGKHQGWVNIVSDLYNINSKKKGLRPLIKAELKVMDYADIMNMKAAKKQMKKVTKIANKLTGTDKAIGQTSVKELQKWLGAMEYKDIPALLIGEYPRY